MATKHVVLIHAVPVSIQPIRDAFQEGWPEAEISNLLPGPVFHGAGQGGGAGQGPRSGPDEPSRGRRPVEGDVDRKA